MHINSYLKMRWFKDTYLSAGDYLEILDVGSLDYHGDYNYGNIFNEKNWNYTGLDFMSGNNVDILVKDIYNWVEIDDNSYDVVVSGQLFEHIEFFWLVLSQIERVLKPGGYLCIVVPSAGPKHDPNMKNCYRFQEDGLRAMAKYINLEILHVSVDSREEVKPWHDACLVAFKSSSNSNKYIMHLEARINYLEGKLDSILSSFNKE